uniref:Uncharacterized protein n=1 Tax=Romanomermis culicivorax TaxID=13658 RepID=A0A915KZ71_ROMCU
MACLCFLDENYYFLNRGRRLVKDPNVDMSDDDEPQLDNGNMDNDGAFENDDKMDDVSGIVNSLNNDGGDGVWSK